MDDLFGPLSLFHSTVPDHPSGYSWILSQHSDDVAARFLQVWNESHFLFMLRQGDVDAALQALSNTAEYALQASGSNLRSCFARSQS